MIWLLFPWLACDLDYLERRQAVSMDYLIDRPRILAVDFDPPAVWPGSPTEITVLGLGPDQQTLEEVQVDLCTLGEAFPTRVNNLECHNVPEFVEPLGIAPLTWTPPQRDGFDCDRMLHDWQSYADVDCATLTPLLFTAETGDGERALGTLEVTLPFDDALPYLEPRTARYDALTLTVDGTPTPGGTLTLRAEITLIDSTSAVFGADPAWFVDGGELTATGRTRWTATDSIATPPVLLTTDNALRLPDDWRGPLRIVLVVADDYEAHWVVHTVDVQ